MNNLNRIYNHMMYNAYGELVTTTTMKFNKQLCPWKTLADIKNNTEQINLQKIIGCKCQYADSCRGFCTFPTNGTLEVPSGILYNLNNTNMFIIPSSLYDRELYAETDIEVTDDIEIYFIKANKLESFITELNNSNSLLNIHKQFNAIFQGFGGYNIETDTIEIPEYLARNNTLINEKNELTLSGFIISKYTPFNISHKITQNTLLTGYDWEEAKANNFKIQEKTITNENETITINTIPGKNTKILKAGYVAVIRVRSWWSNNIKCEGNIIAKVTHEENTMPQKLKDVLEITSHYDFIERNQGFFKYQQETLHKSNVYSIKINNSGLNPETSKKLNYYTKQQVIEKLKIAGQPTLENTWIGNNRDINLNYNKTTDMFYYDVTKQLQTLLHFKFNPDENINISFIELSSEIGWVYDNDLNLFYHKDEKNYIDKINKIKANMRNILENAIHSSISKYMPVETNLWKIIYAGN